MTTLREALAAAARQLDAGGIDGAARDARLLLAHAAGLSPDRLTLHLGDPLDPDMSARLDRALAARLARRPVSQIVGGRLFWGRWFTVTGDVLDPRPETETLIAAALERPFLRVLDLGTGSGAIVLTLLAERAAATGLGVDISAPALAVAQANARALGLQARADFLHSDWGAGVAGCFDLIVSNPPYIAADEMAGLAPETRLWEPHLALTPGGDGLDAYRIIAAQAPALLTPGGRLLVEIGPTQAPAVAALFADAGLVDPQLRRDLDGRARVVGATLARVTDRPGPQF